MLKTHSAYNPGADRFLVRHCVVGLRAPYPADEVANLGSRHGREITASATCLQEQAFNQWAIPVDRPRRFGRDRACPMRSQFWHVCK